jgi:hypothetical protein
MMKREIIAIADIYVPVKRRATLDQKRVDEIAASVLDKSQQTPILVRYLACDLLFRSAKHRVLSVAQMRN